MRVLESVLVDDQRRVEHLLLAAVRLYAERELPVHGLTLWAGQGHLRFARVLRRFTYTYYEGYVLDGEVTWILEVEDDQRDIVSHHE